MPHSPTNLRARLSILAALVLTPFLAPILAPILASILASILVSCDRAPATGTGATGSADAAADAPQPVKLQLNWVAEPEFGGFFAAREAGTYKAEGLDVDIVQGGPDVPVPQLVGSGKVEFAVVGGTQILELNEQGGDLIALYAVYQHNPMGVMVHESSPHETLTQLWESESTLAIQDGLADYQWLNKRFPPGRRKLVPYTANLAQFAADPSLASQCFVTSEPISLALKGVKTRVFMFSDAGFDPYTAVVVTRRVFFEKNRDLCARFVRASAIGWRAYLNDPAATNALMNRLNPAMSVEAMKLACDAQMKLIADDESKRMGLGGMRYARWDEIASQMAEIGKIKAKPDPQTLFHWDSEAGTAR